MLEASAEIVHQFHVGQPVRFVSTSKHASPLRHVRYGEIGHVLGIEEDDERYVFVRFGDHNCWMLDHELEAVQP